MKFSTIALLLSSTLATTLASNCKNVDRKCAEEIRAYRICEYEGYIKDYDNEFCHNFIFDYENALTECQKTVSEEDMKCRAIEHYNHYSKLYLEIDKDDENGNECPLYTEMQKTIKNESEEDYHKRLLDAVNKQCRSTKCSEGGLNAFELEYKAKLLESTDSYIEFYSDIIEALKSCKINNIPICHTKYVPNCNYSIRAYRTCEYEENVKEFHSEHCQNFIFSYMDILPECQNVYTEDEMKCKSISHYNYYSKMFINVDNKDENGKECPLYTALINTEKYEPEESIQKRMLKAAEESCYSKMCSEAGYKSFLLDYMSKKLLYPNENHEYNSKMLRILDSCQNNQGNKEDENISTDGKCGKNNGKKCPSDKCCSKHGYCGTTDKYCSVELGCQSEFGKCNEPSSTGSSISKDGK
eukprot:jgi/Orpsp1_1/1182256/evm.model.c7180000080514.1